MAARSVGGPAEARFVRELRGVGFVVPAEAAQELDLQGAAALEYLSYYGTNVTLQHEWLNLAIAGGATVDEFWQYKIPSLLPMPETGVFSRGSRDSSG